MPSGKLVDVAVQVLLADLVERALVRTLEHSPEGLNAVHVHRIPDVLCGTVVRSGPQKLDSFFRGFKCTATSIYAALNSGFRL